MEAELKAKYPDTTIELIKGSGGVFDVVCNGQLVYSKQHIEGRRFPNVGEVGRLIEKEMG